MRRAWVPAGFLGRQRGAPLLRWGLGKGEQKLQLGQVSLRCLWLLVVGVWSSGESPQAGQRRIGVSGG